MSAMSVAYELMVKHACDAQANYCSLNRLPHFAPNDGVCWNCDKQIYDTEAMRDKAGKELITGCPHCSRTYCD